jgi:acetyl-CoA carboxylase biotin carboxyl carrier protein
MAEKDIDLKKIKELIDLMKQNGLEELEINYGQDKIYLKRSQPGAAGISQRDAQGAAAANRGQDALDTTFPVAGQSAGAADTGVAAASNLVSITSPIVGTFYAKPSPDSEPYVEIGSKVEPQTVVCIIEAMKVMNEIKAETSGTIVEVLVKDGQAVEYGQVLFKVRPE